MLSLIKSAHTRQGDSMPPFSVIIISLGRQDQLKKCLSSLPKDARYIVVGLEEGSSLGARLNQAMESVPDEWILLIDESAQLTKNYVEQSLLILEDKRVDILGGPDVPVEDSFFLQSRAIALSSPFCTGTTFVRHRGLGKKLLASDEERLTHRAFWIRKSVIEKGMSFDETDSFFKAFFLQKSKQNGFGVYYHPMIKVLVGGGQNVKELWMESFSSGFYRSELNRRKMSSGSEIFWLPAVFFLMHLLILVDLDLFLEGVKLYAGLVICVSIGLSMKRRKVFSFPLVAIMHYFIVMAYGIGFLCERLVQVVGNSKKEL